MIPLTCTVSWRFHFLKLSYSAK